MSMNVNAFLLFEKFIEIFLDSWVWCNLITLYVFISRLQSTIEQVPSSSESLSNITECIIDSFPNYPCKPAGVHKLLISVFPDLQAQQTANEPDEIYYLGIKVKENSEEKILQW